MNTLGDKCPAHTLHVKTIRRFNLETDFYVMALVSFIHLFIFYAKKGKSCSFKRRGLTPYTSARKTPCAKVCDMRIIYDLFNYRISKKWTTHSHRRNCLSQKFVLRIRYRFGKAFWIYFLYKKNTHTH